MAQEPAPGDDDPAPSVPVPSGSPPGDATPDWVDDQDWELICAAHAAQGEPGISWDDLDAGLEDLAEVPLDVITAQAEADAAEHGALAGRLIAAGLGGGYAHCAGDPPVPGVFGGPAAGFGTGRYLDSAAPDTPLAALADDASGEDRGFGGVSDDELMGLLGARARLECRQGWEKLMAVAEFIRRRPGPGCAAEGPGRMPRVWSEHAAGELRAQLHLTSHEADVLLDLAHDLAARLPVTSAALRDGVIDLGKAQVIAARCAALTAAEARAAEGIVFGCPGVAQWTWGMVRDRVGRAVIEVNPQAAARRREQGARRRRVEVRAEDSGNAMVAGRELPPAAALAASQLLTVRARELRRAGVGGGMDELRVLAYLEKLGVLDPLGGPGAAGQDQGSSGPADSGGPGAGAGGDAGQGPGDGPGDGNDSGNGGGGPSGPGNPGGGGGAGALPGTVPAGFAARANLTLPLATLLGLAERPGMMPLIGPVDPALARDLAAAAARNPASTWCLTITGAQGRPLAHGCGRPPPPGQDRQNPPGAAARDGPVTVGADRGPPGGYGTVRLSTAAFTSTAGHSPGRGQDQASGTEAAGRNLVFALEPLAGPCDHKHQAKGHDPGRMLRHLTGILNSTCTFPPCRRPEHQSDYEHSVPWDKGGKTCLCDAGPVCRHDHRDKQAPGWRLEQAGARGWFRWTTPSGRSYLSGPTQYPD